MRSIFILMLVVFILTDNLLVGQTRNIHGRVLSEDLEPLFGVEIRNSADSTLGKTDMDGYFKISVSLQTDSLFFRYVGMEWVDIELKEDCNSIEILIMYSTLYHYKSSNKIDRLRKRRYDDLTEKHSNAIEKGLFRSSTICYEKSFESCKTELDNIKRKLKVSKKENFKEFKHLLAGDTVRIPFGINSSGKSVDTYYSICRDCTENDYEYVIEGIIVDKYRKHLTLDVKVLGMDSYDSIEYEGNSLRVGSRFKYKMKYFDVVIN